METNLSEKVVLITGASGGIGSACAKAFHKEGASLVLHGNRNMDVATALARELGSGNLAVQADLRIEDEVDGMFDLAVRTFGQIDAVVANAGIWPESPAPIHKMDPARWREVMESNLTAPFLCARAFFRHLESLRPSAASLVFIGSSAALFGEADHAEYAASKAGLAYGLTKSLKNEIVRLVPRGRVNTVCPGWTRTPMAAHGLEDLEALTDVLQTRALQRIARPEDVASAVVFLSSDSLAGHITGEIWNVTGGMEGRLIHRRETIDPSKA